MTTRITTSNIETATLAQLGGPKITNIEITDNSYTVLDDTAVDVAGGYILITGTGFESGCQVVVNNTAATSVTFVSATQVRAQVPATAAGTYIVYLINPTGGVAIRVNGITFSGTPTWVSGSALAGEVDTAISIQLTATGATTFELAAGSTLPPGVTLSSGGLLSGTITGITEETVYNFVINAVDAELQDSPRSFAFTVTSGDPLFAATTLLLPGSATTFVQDASSNNFPVTVFGDTRPNTFNPYLTGWSNYFDGAGDNTAVATNAVFNLGLNDFSFEAWIYPISITNTSAVIASQWGLNGDEGIWQLALTGNNFIWQYDVNGAVPAGTISVSTTGGIVFNQWQHVLVTRTASGGNSLTRLFINGVLQAYNSVAAYSITSSASPVRLGMQGFTTYRNGEPYQGYISNFRFVNGSIPTAYATSATTVGTAVFTPATEPLTTTSQGATSAQVQLLLAQSNRFVDNSTNAFAVTRNGDVRVESFSPFAEPATTNGSGYFDGTGDYLSVPNNSALDLGSGDYTIEGWWYFTDTSNQALVSKYTGSNGYVVQYQSNNLRMVLGLGSSDAVYSFSWTATPNTWNHVAITRSGTSGRAFINGTQIGSTTTFTTSNTVGATTLQIGSTQTVSELTRGYVSNFRLVKGTAVYTTAFTPPTQPLTTVANTSLLTLQTNQPANNSQFLDSSGNNFPITRAGNTTQGTFSPYSPAGWSNYFDGTGDYLSVGNNAALNLSGGDFTVEAWIYLTALPAINPDNNRNACIFNYGSSTTNQGYTFNIDLTNNTIAMQSNGSANLARASFTFALGTWYHVAATRSGSTDRLFVNGQLLTLNANTFPNNSSATGTLKIGSERLFATYNGDFPGYISNVRIVKGTAVYTANFTPGTTPLTAIPGTSLLTCADNRFIDGSANNFAITRNGDTRVTNWSPFRAQTQTPITYSGFFDGSGDLLTTSSNTAFEMGSGDFTAECWFNATSNNDGGLVFKGQYQAGSTWLPGFGIRRMSATQLRFYFNTSSTLEGEKFFDYTVVTNLNTWYHVAMVVSSGVGYAFVNGTLVNPPGTSGVGAIGTSATGITIGAFPFTVINLHFTGCISNARIVKGTAVYTADFTPPAQPLTAIAGTSLLTCQSATFIDNSTNNFAITAAGNSQPTTVNPFGPTSTNSTGYTASEYSGSMYFDGTGDSLVVPANPLTYFSNLPFTMEAWVYPNASNGIIAGRRAQVAARGFYLAYNSSNNFIFWAGDTDVNTWNLQLTSSSTYPLNQWYHVAATRNDSNVFTLWVNGVSVASATASFAIADDTTNLQIGIIDTAGSPFNGYISDLRIAKGNLLYTSNFVPPIQPLTPVANTVLLLNGTSAAVTDATTRNVLETVGDVRISTVQSKFGSSSMSFDGTGDYLIVPASPVLDFGTGDFTIETWVNFSALTSNRLLLDRWATGNANSWQLYWRSTGTSIAFLAGASTVLVQDPNGSNIVVGTWNHIAVTRSGTTVRLFVNGIVVATNTSSVSFTSTLSLGIGMQTTTVTNPFNGYLQDLRITKGHARYTANFTPTVTAFQTR